ncbi:MAG: hypothetical protein FD174_2329 [Geobacteraceae bacterium]|nr:MAG: hypothetical protein FD174_2329 [Geobacteraceae bacterium]
MFQSAVVGNSDVSNAANLTPDAAGEPAEVSRTLILSATTELDPFDTAAATVSVPPVVVVVVVVPLLPLHPATSARASIAVRDEAPPTIILLFFIVCLLFDYFPVFSKYSVPEITLDMDPQKKDYRKWTSFM